MTPAFNRLVEAFQVLPGIGPKSASRLALFLLEKKSDTINDLATALSNAAKAIVRCSICRNFSEDPVCSICSSTKRDKKTICVVETPSDLMSIEQSSFFDGQYFVLMGHLSPIEGIGPQELGIDKLLQNCTSMGVTEVILATSTKAEGEITAQYIFEALQKQKVSCSRIGYGIPIGGEIEYIDANTLKQALQNRQLWQKF